MNIIDCQQGSEKWLGVRAAHYTASEAPAAMGKSRYMNRSDLLKQKHTGLAPDVDSFKQALFDRGHTAEASARAIAASIIGSGLYPITASRHVDGIDLLASLDGITMNEEFIWEHKLYSEKLACDVKSGTLDPHYTIQLDQQLLVTGAKKCLFMTSDGTEEKMAYCWYESSQEKFDALSAGWQQFKRDLAAYVPPEVVQAAVAAPIMSMPALAIQIKGEVTLSNLPQFREAAEQFIANIKTDLVTDEDFADAEATVKFCDAAEKNLEQAKSAAIAQTASIDELMRTIDHIKKQLSTKRLMLDKLVKSEKESRKAAIVSKAGIAFTAHIESLEKETRPIQLNVSRPDFGGAMKGLKKLSAMQEAVDNAMRNGMFEADTVAKDIRCKLAWFKTASASEYDFLFRDLQTIIQKPLDDLTLIVEKRIADHKAAEAAKLEAERERIRAEEEKRVRAKIEQERFDDERAKAEQARLANAGKVIEERKERDNEMLRKDAIDEEDAAKAQATEPAQAPLSITPPIKQAMPDRSPVRDEIIDTIAFAYGVTEKTAEQWLINEFQKRAA